MFYITYIIIYSKTNIFYCSVHFYLVINHDAFNNRWTHKKTHIVIENFQNITSLTRF